MLNLFFPKNLAAAGAGQGGDDAPEEEECTQKEGLAETATAVTTTLDLSAAHEAFDLFQETLDRLVRSVPEKEGNAQENGSVFLDTLSLASEMLTSYLEQSPSLKFLEECRRRDIVRQLCSAMTSIANNDDMIGAAVKTTSPFYAYASGIIAACEHILIELAKTKIGQEDISASIDMLVSLAVDDRGTAHLGTMPVPVAATPVTPAPTVPTDPSQTVSSSSTLGARSVYALSCAGARNIFSVINLSGILGSNVIDTILDQHVLTMFLHKAQAAAQRPELIPHAAELGALAMHFIKSLNESCSKKQYVRMSALFKQDGIYTTISRLLCAFPISSTHHEIFENAYLDTISWKQASQASGGDGSTSFSNVESFVAVALAADHCIKDDDLTFRILGLLIKAYAAAQGKAIHLESRFGVFANICGSVPRLSSSAELVAMIFKAAETVSIALDYFPKRAIKQLCTETARTAIVAFADTYDAAAEDICTCVSALEMMTMMARYINNLLDFKRQDLSKLEECGVMHTLVIPILGSQYDGTDIYTAYNCCELHCKVLAIFRAILSKSDIGKFSDAWLDRSVIEHLAEFILMHSGHEHDECSEIKDAKKIGELRREYQSSNVERARLSEMIFYMACQKNVAMLETYVRLLVDLLAENQSDSSGSIMRVWNMLLSMMKANRLVCEYFCAAKGFETCIQCLQANHHSINHKLNSSTVILNTITQSLAGAYSANRSYFLKKIGYATLAKALASSSRPRSTVRVAKHGEEEGENDGEEMDNAATTIIEAMVDVFQGVPEDCFNADAISLLFESSFCMHSEESIRLTLTRVVCIVQRGGLHYAEALARTDTLAHILSRYDAFSTACRRLALQLFGMIGVHTIKPVDLHKSFSIIYASLGSEMSTDLLNTIVSIVRKSHQVPFVVGQGVFTLAGDATLWPPPAGVTFSCWFQMDNSRSLENTVRIFELTDPATGYVLFAIRIRSGQHLDVQTGNIVLSAEINEAANMDGIDITDGLWHNILVSHGFGGRKKKIDKHMISGKIMLCLDGMPVLEGASFPFSIFPQNTRKKAGNGDRGRKLDPNTLQGILGGTLENNLSLGPTLLASEATSILAARAIFIRGPSHPSAFLGSMCSNMDAMIRLLHICRHQGRQVSLENLGMDLTSYPALKASFEIMCEFSFRRPDSILFFFNPSSQKCVMERDAVFSQQIGPQMSQKARVHTAILQPANDFCVFDSIAETAQIILKGTSISACPTPFSGSLECIGGIVVILPLLDVRSSTHIKDLRVPLDIIGALLNGDVNIVPASDMKRMDGYRILGYLLLRIAEKGLLTPVVFRSVLDLVYGTDGAKTSGVIGECDAVRFLLMNHAILCRSGGEFYPKLRHQLLSSMSMLLTQSDAGERNSEQNNVNVITLRSVELPFWLLNTMLEDAFSIAGVKSVFAVHSRPANLGIALRELIRLAGSLLTPLLAHAMPATSDLLSIRDVLIYTNVARVNCGSTDTSGFTEMQVTLFRELSNTYEISRRGESSSDIEDAYSFVFFEDIPLCFAQFLNRTCPSRTMLMGMRLMLQIAQCQRVKGRKNSIFVEPRRALHMVMQRGDYLEFSDVGGLFVLLIAVWLDAPIYNIPIELLDMSSREDLSNSLTAETLIQLFLSLRSSALFQKASTKGGDSGGERKSHFTPMSVPPNEMALRVRQDALELVVNLLEENMTRKDTKTDRCRDINDAVTTFLHAVVNSECGHAAISQSDPKHFAYQMTRIAFASAVISDASGARVSTQSMDLTLNIVDGYLDSMPPAAGTNPNTFDSRSGATKQGDVHSLPSDPLSRIDSVFEGVDPSMFEVPGPCFVVLSMLCDLVCNQLNAGSFAQLADDVRASPSKRASNQSNALNNILECVFNAFPVSATPAEALSFAAALLKALRERLRSESHRSSGQSVMESARAAQLATLCTFLAKRCTEGWYPLHSLDMCIVLLEVVKELQRRTSRKMTEEAEELASAVGATRRLVLWILSRRDTPRQNVLKLLRVIEVHDIVMFENMSKKSKQHERSRDRSKSILTSPHSAARTRISYAGGQSMLYGSNSMVNSPTSISGKDFLLAFSHVTFVYLVDDNQNIRETTIRLWRAMLMHKQQFFLDMIGISRQLQHQITKSEHTQQNIAVNLFQEGFAHLLTDLNMFSLWLATHIEQVTVLMKKKPAHAFRKFERLSPNHTVPKSKSKTNRVPIEETIYILQLERKQIWNRKSHRLKRTPSKKDMADFDKHSSAIGGLTFVSQKEAEVLQAMRNWQTSTLALCETGRRKWYNLVQSLDHECSVLRQERVTRWKLDEREGPLRMKLRLKRYYSFYDDYGFSTTTAAGSSGIVGWLEACGPLCAIEGKHGMAKKSPRVRRHSAVEILKPEDQIDNNADMHAKAAETVKAISVLAPRRRDRRYRSLSEDFSEASGPASANMRPPAEARDRNSMLSPPEHTHTSSVKISNLDPAEALASFVPIHDGGILLKLNILMSRGLEAIEGLFLVCSAALHFVGNFAVDPETGGVSELTSRDAGKKTIFKIQLHPSSDDEACDTSQRSEDIWQQENPHHESYRIALNKIRVFHKRRYLLRHVAIEVFDTDGGSMFIVFPTNEERDELFNFMWHMHMPACILHMKNSPGISSSRMQVTVTSTPKRVNKKARTASVGTAPGEGTKLSIPAAFRSFREQLTRSWLDGKLSNFGYLMYLNSLAGRSTNDLTQYPVFPWVLSQYSDDMLDLSNPATFRDLSKPMGALAESRAKDFADRYKELAELNEPDLAPFHYGTHYSTSGYTLYYLLRLEPFARMGAQLQNGKFDDPSRLFRSVAASWKSASGQNSGTTQDVRELVPEFFYSPHFLVNGNNFSFGTTQSGIKVNDVELPPWAQNSPSEFVRLHRLALESEHVSRNLHHWIDLVFGFKQLGKDAEEAQNVFMALTYEAEVNVDDIEDDDERAAMLSQILNFGQTPSQLFDTPHPRKVVPSKLASLPGTGRRVGVGYHAGLSGPLVIPGIFPPVCSVKSTIVSHNGRIYVSHAPLSSSSGGGNAEAQQDFPVVDMFVTQKRAKYVCCPYNAILAPPTRSKYVSFGYTDGSCRFHIAHAAAPKHPRAGSIVSIHEGLHIGMIQCAAATNDGSLLITGGEDCTVAVHTFVRVNSVRSLSLLGRLACHKGPVVSITVCEAYGIIVSGSEDGTAIIWDLHRLKFTRQLTCFAGVEQRRARRGVSTVSCNEQSGDILTLWANEIRLWNVNGVLLARQDMSLGVGVGRHLAVTKALFLPREPWQDGVAVVTGHENGGLCLWSIEYPTDGNIVMDNGVKRKQNEAPSAATAWASAPAVSSAEGALLVLKQIGYVGQHSSPITALNVTGTGSQTVLASGDSAGSCLRTTLDLEATVAESELNEVL